MSNAFNQVLQSWGMLNEREVKDLTQILREKEWAGFVDYDPEKDPDKPIVDRISEVLFLYTIDEPQSTLNGAALHVLAHMREHPEDTGLPVMTRDAFNALSSKTTSPVIVIPNPPKELPPVEKVVADFMKDIHEINDLESLKRREYGAEAKDLYKDSINAIWKDLRHRLTKLVEEAQREQRRSQD